MLDIDHGTFPYVTSSTTVAAGAYLLQMRRITLAELLRPFGTLVDQTMLSALAAGFVYSLGAVIVRDGYPFMLHLGSPWDRLKRM